MISANFEYKEAVTFRKPESNELTVMVKLPTYFHKLKEPW